MSDRSFIKVEVTLTFKRNLKNLGKYRSIRNDLEPVIQQLQNGELPGNQISGIGYKVFKLRVKNSVLLKVKVGAIVLFTIAKQQQVLFY